MVGLEGRENVRSTLGFLDSDGPLGDTLGADVGGRRGYMSEDKGKGRKIYELPQVCETDVPALVSKRLLVLKMSVSKLRLPLLWRRAGDVRQLGDSGFRGSAEPARTENCCTQTANYSCTIAK